MLSEILGGVQALQGRLTYALQHAAQARGLTSRELDAACGLAVDGQPSVEQLWAHPEILTGDFFCRLSNLLSMGIDEALRHDLTDQELALVLEDMKSTSARLVPHTANGQEGRPKIRPEEFADAYFCFRLLDELDAAACPAPHT